MPSRGGRIIFAFLLICGIALAVWLGTWIRYHPPTPKIVIHTVTVPQPCPPSKSGPATTKGTQSPAQSGSGNSVNYGTQPQPKKP
jgi:hypothetical protein